MKKNENKIFEDTKKTVIYAHRACRYTIDQSIASEATYIEPAPEEWTESGESLLYYLESLREAAHSIKKYIIMEFEPRIGALFNALMSVDGQSNCWKWRFYTFFHADTCPEGAEPNPMYNADDEKMAVLWEMDDYFVIAQYTIPPDYNLTTVDFEKMEKDSKSPETIKELRRIEWYIRKGKKPPKLSFSFYEPDRTKIRAYVSKQP